MSSLGTGTPCIRVCKLENGLCTGCFRTIEEIENWLKYSDEQREQITRILEERAKIS